MHFFSTLIPLFILVAVNNEFELGNILAIISVVAAISYVMIGKKINFKHFRKSIVLGIIMQIIGIASILISPNFVTFMFYSIIQTISLPFTNIPSKVMVSNLVHKLPEYENHRVEYIAIVELLSVGLGWIPSYLLLLFFTDLKDPLIITLLLSIMIVFLVVEMILLLGVKKENYSD